MNSYLHTLSLIHIDRIANRDASFLNWKNDEVSNNDENNRQTTSVLIRDPVLRISLAGDQFTLILLSLPQQGRDLYRIELFGET
jgi:hypothetical protein